MTPAEHAFETLTTVPWEYDPTTGYVLFPEGLPAKLDESADGAKRVRIGQMMQLFDASDQLNLTRALLHTMQEGEGFELLVSLRQLKPVERALVSAVPSPCNGAAGPALVGTIRFLARVEQPAEAGADSRIADELLDGVDVAVCLIDAAGRVVHGNRAWRLIMRDVNVAPCGPGTDYFDLLASLSDEPDLDRRLKQQLHGEKGRVAMKVRLIRQKQPLDCKIIARPVRMAGRRFRMLTHITMPSRQMLSGNSSLARDTLPVEAWFEWYTDTGQFVPSLSFVRLFGSDLGQEQSFDHWFPTLAHIDDCRRLRRELGRCLINRAPLALELRLTTLQGGERWFRLSAEVAPNRDDDTYLVGRLVDIDSERQLRDEVREREVVFNALEEHLPVVFYSLDVASDRCTFVSKAYEAISGRCREALLDNPRDWITSVAPEDRERVQRQIERASKVPGSSDMEFGILDGDGQHRRLQARFVSLANEKGQVVRRIGIATDVTEQRETEDKLVRATHLDATTGLPNRLAFSETLAATLSGAQGEGQLAVAIMGLDRFKSVNDSLGHSVGDEYLRKLSTRLLKATDGQAYLARVGGDEFAFLMPRMQGQDAIRNRLVGIRNSLAIPIVVDGESITLGATLGVACYPHDGDDPGSLLKAADIAMTRGKKLRCGGIEFCSERVVNLPDRRQLRRQMALHNALQGEEFELYFQPKYGTGDLVMRGAETLLRWRHPREGLIPASEFIPQLEKSGDIVPVTWWLLNTLCGQIADWRNQGLALDQFFAVNISPRSLLEPDFDQKLLAIVQANGLPPQCIELELTESSLMVDLEHARALLERVRKAGIRLAIDDFGTGYSSLSYLRHFAPDVLKIDRSFIRDCDRNVANQRIIQSVVGMAHGLDMITVAEGVETREQLEQLQKLGCDRVQGYLLATPMPIADFVNHLRQPVAESVFSAS
ncbi:EAL domain-containing protein [Marinobacter sp. NFXS9]|uniref:putative bifunctional diguanylate cyclase/phosphodiesterase n=1 Tax=Marinobacter sp. NFXS9 TaxID=2818433 RepID=UPI0032E0020E